MRAATRSKYELVPARVSRLAQTASPERSARFARRRAADRLTSFLSLSELSVSSVIAADSRFDVECKVKAVHSDIRQLERLIELTARPTAAQTATLAEKRHELAVLEYRLSKDDDSSSGSDEAAHDNRVREHRRTKLKLKEASSGMQDLEDDETAEPAPDDDDGFGEVEAIAAAACGNKAQLDRDIRVLKKRMRKTQLLKRQAAAGGALSRPEQSSIDRLGVLQAEIMYLDSRLAAEADQSEPDVVIESSGDVVHAVAGVGGVRALRGSHSRGASPEPFFSSGNGSPDFLALSDSVVRRRKPRHVRNHELELFGHRSQRC